MLKLLLILARAGLAQYRTVPNTKSCTCGQLRPLRPSRY